MSKETIDLITTWSEATNMLLAIMEHGTKEGKKIAKVQFKDMANTADAFKEACEVLMAINARINGEWNNPYLIKYGGMLGSITEDIETMITIFLEKVKISKE